MAQTTQVKKRIKQALENRTSNRRRKTIHRHGKQNLIEAMTSNNLDLISEKFTILQKELDRSARLGIIHKNKAARIKSAFHLKIKQIIS